MRFASHVKSWIYCCKIKQSTLNEGFKEGDCWLVFVLTTTINDFFCFLLKTQKGRGEWLKHLKHKAVNFIV